MLSEDYYGTGYNYGYGYGDEYSYRAMKTQYKTLEEALALVENAIEAERDDELFYDDLITIAPSEEEKEIITSIRDDERKHYRYFREIYTFFTQQRLNENIDESKENRPKSYIEGIKKAKFEEMAAVEKYRDIRAGIPYEYYRDMVYEIITDEQKHADKYDYILSLNLERRLDNMMKE